MECEFGRFREGVRGYFEDEDGEGMEGLGIEECGGERGFGGGEEVGEAFEDGHLMDELVDVRDVQGGGETDAGEERVTHWGGLRQYGGWSRRRSWWRWRCGGSH